MITLSKMLLYNIKRDEVTRGKETSTICWENVPNDKVLLGGLH